MDGGGGGVMGSDGWRGEKRERGEREKAGGGGSEWGYGCVGMNENKDDR